MARIGYFKPMTDGYTGTIRTLTIDIKAQIVANDDKRSDDAPDFRVFAGRGEIGAAWKARSQGDKPVEYLRLVLDDPSFPQPAYAALFEEDGAAYLVWRRRGE